MGFELKLQLATKFHLDLVDAINSCQFSNKDLRELKNPPVFSLVLCTFGPDNAGNN